MTDLELLESSIKQLGLVEIPISLFEKVGLPIYNVRQRLAVLYKSISASVAPKDKPEESRTEEEHPNEEASDSDTSV